MSEHSVAHERTVMQFRAQVDEAKCIRCGCTDSRACRQGCSWAVVNPARHLGICTACWFAYENLGDLRKTLEQVLGQLVSIKIIARPFTTRDRLVSPRVARARHLWREARVAAKLGWHDVAMGKEDQARYWLRMARWTKRERIAAGVYGR